MNRFAWIAGGAAIVAAGLMFAALTDFGRAQPVAARAAIGKGDSRRGAVLISQFGCGTCHVVPGIASARGKVGPSLAGVGERVYIAGMLANTPENMVQWLRHPQKIVPGNAMPDLGLNDADAADLTAYLATLR
jgi:cytochrome c2